MHNRCFGHLLLMAAIILTFAMPASAKQAADFCVRHGEAITYCVKGGDAQVVNSALVMLADDVADVLGGKLERTARGKAKLLISTANSGAPQGFSVNVADGRLCVVGNDAQGTAYGIMELSRLLGVSPWKWWADSKPEAKEVWTVKADYATRQSPAVEFRGIFINDEDNGLCPWAWQTHDPSGVKGRIGPATHERIFQLMLRLRANVFWPAMHSCSRPFYTIEGNKAMADKYGITIGTSHCEPMMCCVNGEWNKKRFGEYNYVTNRDSVLAFWERRVRQTAGSNCFFTLGMRGVHDTGMEGVTTDAERLKYLQMVIDDQRRLIERHVSSDATKVPQVFIPYKEVLPVYKAGLRVPDDVTLMWCDDNYGFVRHQPTEAERRRKGGNGLYYHFSYWGRPQSHTWLPSIDPALTQTELMRAYDNGIRKLWIFNVGDIKPNEFITEYALDMAWDNTTLHNADYGSYLQAWAKREFGASIAPRVADIISRYYALVYRCRGEMLGHTRVEETNAAWKKVSDLPWTDSEVRRHLEQAESMESEVRRVAPLVRAIDRDKWFELVEFPAMSYAAMARKMLTAQLARHGQAAWGDAVAGQNAVFSLIDRYHAMLGGKWNRMMGVWRGHSMFKAIDTTKTCQPVGGDVMELPVAQGEWGDGSRLIPHMGYTGSVLALAKGDTYTASLPQMADSTTLTLAFVPLHPGTDGRIAVSVAVDGGSPTVVEYQTEGRSEEWKQNIERNQARRTIVLPPSPRRRPLAVKALTEGVIIDEVRME